MSDRLWILGAGSESSVLMGFFKQSMLDDMDDGTIEETIKVDPIGNADATAYSMEMWRKETSDGDFFTLALGDNKKRKELFQAAQNLDLQPRSFIAFRDILEYNEQLYKPEALIVHPGAFIGPSVRVGDGCLINNRATICHHSMVQNFCHIAPNATICGNVTIGECSTIGAGAVVPQNTEVPPNTFVKANSVYTD